MFGSYEEYLTLAAERIAELRRISDQSWGVVNDIKFEGVSAAENLTFTFTVLSNNDYVPIFGNIGADQLAMDEKEWVAHVESVKAERLAALERRRKEVEEKEAARAEEKKALQIDMLHELAEKLGYDVSPRVDPPKSKFQEYMKKVDDTVSKAKEDLS